MNNYQEFKIIDNIAKLIESSFGIHGKLKLISQVFDHKNDEGENDNVVNSTQKIIFTNDGLLIFKSLNNDSPYYKIILQQSNYIKNRFGCGVSQYIILTNNILKRSIKLINNKGSSSSSTSTFSINQILNIFQECRLFIKNNFNERFIINLKDEIFSSSGGKNDQLLESIIKTNLSKNILSIYFKRISKIFKKLIKILPNLDKNKIKIKTIISSNEDHNNNNEDEDEKKEEEDDDDNDEIEIKLLNGILIKSKFSFAGRDKLIKVIENPKILLLDYEIELKHQKEFANIEISNVNDYLEFINAEKSLISKQLENIYNLNINLILNKKVIGDLAIQEFVKISSQNQNNNNKINCIGSINNINEFEFIKKSIGGNTQSSLQNLSLDSSFYGTCKKYKQIIIGKKSYELFEGCQFSDTQTIILKGSSKKFLKEAKLGLESLLTIFRSIIIDDDFKFVGSSSNFEFIIINLLNELIKNKQNSSSSSSSSLSTNLIKEVLIIKSLQKSIKDIIKLLLLNSDLNLDLIDQLFQINNNNNNSCINIEENKIGDILDLNLFEPKSMKLSILNSSIETSCILLKTITT
ncbi:hypothetical protein DDB_G0280227 [Dictyostelium discoideum AX4]|uniref:Uncharacterized protein n=1 Tax=Dictyostelium discoideum TaxID=44689 RepID=Q54VN7_DICDI|nr:hypothetical protein DDB_G0280227 [Dictyostelium discoideum AX4]EAL67340.1 hypothetical protein DDB_G0280227 [Dictyostelium discoideum AX4]|eukprot:XP_641318.1 hypothetical protein DDB_G0280227 [Dictyostelium discoideum AX4]